MTAFTVSDFGRTTAGAATAGKFYGTAPPISVSDAKDTAGAYLAPNQWHVGQGSLLPSTSVDQYAATLAKWFGVDPSEMPSVLPKIVNFGGAGYPVDLGFMG